MRMKSAGLLALLSIAVLAGLALDATVASGARSRPRPSKHDGTVRIIDGGKGYTFYRAEADSPVFYTLRGPATYRISARNLEPGRGVQRMAVEIDGQTTRIMTLSGRSSKTATQPSGEVGRLARATIKLPAGRHKVALVPQSPEGAVAARIVEGQTARKVQWIAFAPDGYERALRCLSGDAETTWYRTTPAKPVVTTVRGPLRMKVTSRLDFGASNGYTQSYVIRVALDGRPWKSYSLKSRSSHTCSYPELPELTPGGARDIMIEIPAGLHKVEMILDGTTSTGAALQIRVPKQEVGRPRS